MDFSPDTAVCQEASQHGALCLLLPDLASAFVGVGCQCRACQLPLQWRAGVPGGCGTCAVRAAQSWKSRSILRAGVLLAEGRQLTRERSAGSWGR